MPKFKFVDFSYDLLQIEKLIEEIEGCLVIYPTKNNVSMAQSYSQDNWQFEDILYLDIKELTEMVLPTELSYLEDDKRIIALFQLLTEEEKVFFKVTDFFDFAKLANKIFTLFEELALELIDFSQVCLIIKDNKLNLFKWQSEYYEKIYLLLLRYQAWLHENKFNDKIFSYQVHKIELSNFAQYKHVYVVNQFYYTAFEKALITKLEKAGKAVTLIYQLPENCVDKKTFNAKEFTYQDLQAIQATQPHLELIIDRNKFTMMNSLCRLVKETKINQIIDSDFFESNYSKLLSPEIFNITYKQQMINSSLYHFFELILLLLESLEHHNNNFYFPLHTLIQALLNPGFTAYFRIKNAFDLTGELQTLNDNGILYCDLEGGAGKDKVSRQLKVALERITILLERIKKVNSISSLIDLFDTKSGIYLDRLISPFDLQYSNIKELVFSELANLQTYTCNNLVKDWHILSDKAEHLIIFQLFCDAIKGKTIRYKPSKETKSNSEIKINSLLDTRNNSYKSLIFLNMKEGILPTKQLSLFLFNEKQRNILKLKTYEKIRLREKYFFHRLVLSSQVSYFLAIESIDEDISISSFLEELPLIKPKPDLRQADRGYQSLFDGEICNPPQVGADFKRVKLTSAELMYPKDVFRLSFTRLNTLMTNPLYYLIQDWARIREKKIPVAPALDYRFVGTFAQDFVNYLVAKIEIILKQGKLSFHDNVFSKYEISEHYESFLNNYPYKEYYIPHNYSFKFLSKILKETIVNGIYRFFTYVIGEKLGLLGHKLEFIPEEGYANIIKQEGERFIEADENDYQLPISVIGDADLRIHDLDTGNKVVIDFKTGKLNLDQLALYQFLYYKDDILDNQANHVSAGIYHIIKQNWESQKVKKKNSKKTTAQEAVDNLRSKIIEILNEIAKSGFALPESKTKAKFYNKITRPDVEFRQGGNCETEK
ncbi:PD-(D/E)XK nuclease family protein [bacterium]|nr:PD-(D/E)XK nuclease family protein [bacterium]